MSFTERIKSMFARGATEPIDARKGQAFYIQPGWIPDGQAISPHEAFQQRAVWQCLNIIASHVSAAPWLVYEVDPDGKRKKLPNDPLAYLLNQECNPDSIAQSVKEALIVQALVYGNGYAEIVKDQAGRVVELWPIQSERAQPPTFDEAGQRIYVFNNPTGPIVTLPADRVFHLRGLSADGFLGLATFGAAAKAAAAAAAADRFSASYFANGMTPSGILTVPAGTQDKNVDELKKSLLLEYAAHRRNGKPLVIKQGTTFTPVSHDPASSQLIEVRQFAFEEVAGYFLVPPYMLGVTAAAQGYGKNLSELNQSFINGALSFWAIRLQQEARKKLIPYRSNKVTVIDFSRLARGTNKEAAEADEIRIRSGVISINEAREEADYNAGEAFLDNHLVLSTYTSAEGVLDPPEPAPAPAAPVAEDPARDVQPPGVAVNAVSALVALGLENHSRRFRARSKDVAADKMESARSELRTKLEAELTQAVALAAAVQKPLNVAALAEAVEAGVEPGKVAAHHFGIQHG